MYDCRGGGMVAHYGSVELTQRDMALRAGKDRSRGEGGGLGGGVGGVQRGGVRRGEERRGG